MELSPKISFIKIVMDTRLKNYIHLAFDSDKDLPLYHITNSKSTRFLANNTFNTILQESKRESLIAYSVQANIGGEVVKIGYTVISKDPVPFLYSFGIKPEYRDGEVLRGWLGEVKKLLGNGYCVGLNQKNTRAIKFFERNGFQIHKQDDKIIILCHSLEEYQQR